MSSLDLYQKRAIECYSLAEEFSDPDQREIMRRLANFWLHLSERAKEIRQHAAAPEDGS
jgi:hypothetical protein